MRRRRRHDAPVGARHADRHRRDRHRCADAGAPRPTTSASPATTSTARRSPASRPGREPDRAADGDQLHRQRRARQPTSTRSPPRTRPGNAGPPTNEAAATVTTDTTAPCTPARAHGTVSGSTVNLAGRASTDNVGVDALQRPPLHDYRVRRLCGEPDRAADRHELRRRRSRDGHLLLPGHRGGRGRQLSAATAELTAVIADVTAPTAPGGLAAAATGTTVALSWTAATDNIGVTRYNVHRGTTSGLHAVGGEPHRAAHRPRLLRPRRGRRVLLQGHRRGRRREYRPRLEHRHGDDRDAVAPSTPGTPDGERRPRPGGAQLARLDRQRRSHPLQRPSLDVAGFIPSTANRVAQPTGTSYTDIVSAGTYFYKVIAEDAAGNLGGRPEAVRNCDDRRRRRARRRVRVRCRERHDCGQTSPEAEQAR